MRLSEEESTVSSTNEICDSNENTIISTTNNDPYIEDITAETSTITSQSTSTKYSVTVSIMRENIILFLNLFLSSLDLELVDVDGEGDCCILAYLTSYLNLR